MQKPILDVCCGGRMWWFDKNDERAVFIVMLGGAIFGLAFALAHLIMSVIPALIKASVAPNLIIIEKLGDVIK